MPALLRTALAVVLAIASFAAAVPAAQAETGAITVTVTAADTGLPVTTACLEVWLSATDPTPASPFVGDVCDTDGVLTYEGLTVGVDYYLEVTRVPGYATTWVGGLDWSSAAPHTPPADLTVVVDRLVPVSGTLTSSDGSPVSGGAVQLSASGGGGKNTLTSTDGAGRWSVLAEPGRYNVQFLVDGEISYAYGRRADEAADLVTVVANQPLTVDNTLPSVTTVQAAITAADTGLPVPGACATLVSTTDPNQTTGYGCADSSGVLVVRGSLPGAWRLQVTDPTFTYAVAESSPFSLDAGQRLTGPAVSMPRAGSLTGRVVDWTTGRPLAGICVYAYSGRAGPFVPGLSRDCSDDDGRWTTRGVPPGRVTVWAEGDLIHLAGYSPGVAEQSSATLHGVVAAGTTRVGTIRLHRGGVLTGRITDHRGRPVAGAMVGIGLGSTPETTQLPYEGIDWRAVSFAGVTDADGRYRIQRVEPIRQPVVVMPRDGTNAWQWSGGATSPESARAVRVEVDSVVRFDAQLRPGARIVADVRGTAGRGGVAAAYSASGALVGRPVWLEGDGPVTLDGLPGGTVRVAVRLGADPVVWFDRAADLGSSTPVAIWPNRPASIAITVP